MDKTDKKEACILRYTLSAVSDMIRTRDLLIRSQTLYPAELHSHIPSEQIIYYTNGIVLSIDFFEKFIIFIAEFLLLKKHTLFQNRGRGE